MNAIREGVDADEDAYRSLLDRIEREQGMRCGSYKDRCIRRRISVRLRANGLHSPAAYSQFLDHNPGEWAKLMSALTINVTRFFRDAAAFAALESQAYPMLRDTFDQKLVVWSAGCSHGHEPYSLAIGLAEAIGLHRVSIHATDIDKHVLSATVAGAYSEHALGDVSRERRGRWFSNETPSVVHSSLRAAVTVSRHDMLQDDVPVKRYHLIACRNVVIYFSRDAQQQLFTTLYNALVPGGILFLGKVETLIGPARDMFGTLNLRERLFQRPTV